MYSPVRVRSDLLRSLDRSLVAIAAAAVLLAVIEVALLPIGGELGWQLSGLPVTFLVYIAAGLIAWHRRPSNRMGSLIVFAGFAVFIGGIGNTEIPLLVGIGTVLATLALPAIIQMLLAFPTGRLSTIPARVIVTAGYVVSLAFQAPAYLLTPDGPFPLPAGASQSGLLEFVSGLQRAVGAVVMLSVAAVLVMRLRRAEPGHRRILIPVFSYGVFAVLFVPLSSIVLSGILGLDPSTRGVLQFAVMTGVPIAFTAGILLGGFARTGELEELGSWLAVDADRRDSLQQALSNALGDPSVRLYFRASESAAFVDERGLPAALDAEDGRRGWQEVMLNDRAVGAIAYDASLIPDRDTVAAAGRVVAIAIDRHRLTADLMSSEFALRRSRERIVDTANRERRHLARDLHDGLQVKLVMLALAATKIASDTEAAAKISTQAAALRAGIDDAAAELRRVVHRLAPAALIERGLGAAAEDLADRMPIRTTVMIDFADGELPELVETTAYYVVAEALTNVVKHAEASTVRVELRRHGGVIHIEIADDGRGGADLHAGTGLQGLADRVDVAGGMMRVSSPTSSGTVLTVELPCGS